jgi:hypothetical protein
LFNNYKQALSIIHEYTPKVERFKAVFHVEDSDFESWRQEELNYLENLSKEPKRDAEVVSYVEALVALDNAQ